MRRPRLPQGRRARVVLAVVVLVAVAISILTSNGSSFDSKASGEHLIRDYIGRFGKGTVSLSSVTCPSGIAQKQGGSYACEVEVRNVKGGRVASGTITIHMVSGNKVEITGAPDIHLH